MSTSISGLASVASAQPPDDSDRQARMKKTMEGAAKLLGMTTDELKDARKSGKSLSDLAAEKGVSKDDLIATVAQGLKDNAPADAPSSMDFTAMATNIVNGTPPGQGQGGTAGAGGHGGHHHKHKLDSDGSNNASSSLSDLLSSSGIDMSDLTSLLSGSSSSSSTSTSTSSSDGSTTSTTTSASSDDFVAQLKSLMAKYDSKGLVYDTSL